MAVVEFQGIYAPLATPFDPSGEIYWSKVDFNLAQLQRTKLSGIVVAGRWGEGPLLSEDEQVQLWKRAAERVAEPAVVIASIGGCSVTGARRLAGEAASAGCTAAILEAPDMQTLAPGTDTADLFFRSVADGASLPLLAAVDTPSADRLAGLSQHPRLTGAVLSGATAAIVQQASSACRQGFALLVSELPSAAECLAAGAAAAVLPEAAAVPFHILSIEEAVRTREQEAAADLTERALAFAQSLQEHGVPALKHALDLRSGYGGMPRLPLLRATPEQAAAVRLSLDELAS